MSDPAKGVTPEHAREMQENIRKLEARLAVLEGREPSVAWAGEFPELPIIEGRNGIIVQQTPKRVTISKARDDKKPDPQAPHPFQIIVVSPTTFYVNEGRLHMPGRALMYDEPNALGTSLRFFPITAVTSVPDYDENGKVYVYLKVYYQVQWFAPTAQWDFVDAEIVATGASAVKETDSDTIIAYYPIGELSLTDGEIDAELTQYIRSDYTETICGVYLYFEE
jgi:hypothetical protein